MKKIAILFAAVSVLMMVTSCQKDSPLAGEKVKIQIEVADLEPGTKAIKTGWTVGDKINIWFGDAYWNEVPQLVLTRTAGGNWDHSEISESVLAGLSASGGTFKAVYEASNSMFNSAINSTYAYFPGNTYFSYNTGSHSGDGFAYPVYLSCYANSVSYEYDSSTKTITATISSWKALTGVQVVVTGLEGDASDYVATFGDNVDYVPAFYNNGGTIERGSFGLCNGVGNASNWGLGIPNPDGVAFNFNSLHVVLPAPDPMTMSVYLFRRSTGKMYKHQFAMELKLTLFVYAMKMPFSSFTVYTD